MHLHFSTPHFISWLNVEDNSEKSPKILETRCPPFHAHFHFYFLWLRNMSNVHGIAFYIITPPRPQYFSHALWFLLSTVQTVHYRWTNIVPYPSVRQNRRILFVCLWVVENEGGEGGMRKNKGGWLRIKVNAIWLKECSFVLVKTP